MRARWLRRLPILMALALLARPAAAIDPKELITTVLNFMSENGLANENDLELLKFTVARPACAETIYSHTASQDYTLIATVIGMKAAKKGGDVAITGLASFDQQQCRDLSPLKSLYTFLDRSGTRFVPDGPGMKAYAKQQIDSGKSQLEGKLSGLPFGDVLKEWPCLCDAAFETNLTEEKIATEAYAKGAKLIKAAKSGDLGKLVEVAVAEFGAELGCSIAVKYSNIGQVPVVGDAAFSACSEIGAAVGWIVKNSWNGAIALGEAMGGQTQHMDPNVYYDEYWRQQLHETVLWRLQGYGKGDFQVDYDACVGYFDAHLASKSTAEEFCGDMRKKLLADIDALVTAIKTVPDAYYFGRLAPQLKAIVLTNYGLVEPAKNFLATQPFQDMQKTCWKEVKDAIPINGPWPGKYNGAPQLGSAPYTAWEWACNGAMEKLKGAALDLKSGQLPALVADMKAKSCVVNTDVPNKLRFRCDTVPGFVACRAAIEAWGVDPLKHCDFDNTAVMKLMVQIASDLGPKRCLVSKADPYVVECTRPWKVEACEQLIGVYGPGVDFGYVYVPKCQDKDDPEYVAAKSDAQKLLDILNGVDPSAPAPGTSGASQSIFSQGKPCRHTFDPLSLTCTTPAPLAKLPSPLQYCAADPNQDGADAPCYDGPLTEGTPAPMNAQAEPQLPAPSSPQARNPANTRQAPAQGTVQEELGPARARVDEFRQLQQRGTEIAARFSQTLESAQRQSVDSLAQLAASTLRGNGSSATLASNWSRLCSQLSSARSAVAPSDIIPWVMRDSYQYVATDLGEQAERAGTLVGEKLSLTEELARARQQLSQWEASTGRTAGGRSYEPRLPSVQKPVPLSSVPQLRNYVGIVEGQLSSSSARAARLVDKVNQSLEKYSGWLQEFEQLLANDANCADSRR